MTREEKMKMLERLKSDPEREETNQAMNEYIDKFKDAFPIYGFPGKYEDIKHIARECVEKGKDVYEMGYMVRPKDLNGIIY